MGRSFGKIMHTSRFYSHLSMVNPINRVAWVSLWIIGAVFAFSGIEHIRNPWIFLNDLFRYRVVDGFVAVAIGAVLPVVQVTVSVMMISGSGRRLGLVVAAVCFLAFTIVQSIAVFRGLDISCGCFGAFSQPISIKTVGLDFALFCAAVFCLIVFDGKE